MAHVHDGDSVLPATIGRTIAIGIALNVSFVVVEALYGWRRGSILASFANAVLLLVATGSLARVGM